MNVSKHLCSCCGSLYGWCADRCAALEDLDDDHRRAAVPADEGRTQSGTGVVGLRAGCGHDVQQPTHLREILPAHGIGQQAIVADAVEAAGQHMQQKMK
ncbi:hypothetical protein OKW38_000041 [Paraburkholderia sp. MM5496-R1]